MGLSFRKSIRVGPFRLSASKSGMNISAGIRGLRVGTGPRGSYISASALGVTVRQPLGGQARAAHSRPQARQGAVSAGRALAEIAGVEVGRLRDSSSASLLTEIEVARRRVHLFPLSIAGYVVGLAACIGMGVHPLLVGSLAVGGIWILVKANERDAVRCRVPIVFHLEEPYLGAFGGLVAALEALRGVGSLWHIEAQGRVRDPRYQAGARLSVQRRRISVLFGEPPAIRTNLDIPQILLGGKRLAFFPDRMLIFEGRSVGALAYKDLFVTAVPSPFVEDGPVPPDAQRVGTTWRYVNRHGGADQRFKSNRQLPVLLYERIQLYSISGFNESLEASRLGAGQQLASIVERFRGIAEQPTGVPQSGVH
jgi:hypothetical protein